MVFRLSRDSIAGQNGTGAGTASSIMRNLSEYASHIGAIVRLFR
jgi:hypothetical protein